MRKLITIILFFQFILSSYGQTVVTGQLIDIKSNEPIWAGNIYIKGTSKGAVTDSLGHFIVDKIEKDTFDIYISFIRFYSLDIKNVTSKHDTINLGQIYMLLDNYGGMHIDGIKEIRNKKGKVKRVKPYSEEIPEQPEKRKYLSERKFYFGKPFNSSEYFQPKSSLNGFEIEYSEFVTKRIESKNYQEILPVETYKYIVEYIMSTKTYKEFEKWSKEDALFVSNQIVPIESMVYSEDIPFDSLKINRDIFEKNKLEIPLWENELLSLSDNFISNTILYFSDYRDGIIVATLKQSILNDTEFFSNQLGSNLSYIFKLENGKIVFVKMTGMFLD